MKRLTPMRHITPGNPRGTLLAKLSPLCDTTLTMKAFARKNSTDSFSAARRLNSPFTLLAQDVVFSSTSGTTSRSLPSLVSKLNRLIDMLRSPGASTDISGGETITLIEALRRIVNFTISPHTETPGNTETELVLVYVTTIATILLQRRSIRDANHNMISLLEALALRFNGTLPADLQAVAAGALLQEDIPPRVSAYQLCSLLNMVQDEVNRQPAIRKVAMKAIAGRVVSSAVNKDLSDHLLDFGHYAAAISQLARVDGEPPNDFSACVASFSKALQRTAAYLCGHGKLSSIGQGVSLSRSAVHLIYHLSDPVLFDKETDPMQRGTVEALLDVLKASADVLVRAHAVATPDSASGDDRKAIADDSKSLVRLAHRLSVLGASTIRPDIIAHALDASLALSVSSPRERLQACNLVASGSTCSGTWAPSGLKAPRFSLFASPTISTQFHLAYLGLLAAPVRVRTAQGGVVLTAPAGQLGWAPTLPPSVLSTAFRGIACSSPRVSRVQNLMFGTVSALAERHGWGQPRLEFLTPAGLAVDIAIPMDGSVAAGAKAQRATGAPGRSASVHADPVRLASLAASADGDAPRSLQGIVIEVDGPYHFGGSVREAHPMSAAVAKAAASARRRLQETPQYAAVDGGKGGVDNDEAMRDSEQRNRDATSESADDQHRVTAGAGDRYKRWLHRRFGWAVVEVPLCDLERHVLSASAAQREAYMLKKLHGLAP